MGLGLFPVEDSRVLLLKRKFRKASLVKPLPCFTGVLYVVASSSSRIETPGGGGLPV